jgi:flagellar hook-basal body complex protein FliE
MSEMQISQVLAQMRTLTQQAGMGASGAPGGPSADFANLLKQSLDQVNETQQNASRLRTAFETGDSAVSLVDVMTATQKASISFEAITQVRNRLLSAYQEIMKMPV